MVLRLHLSNRTNRELHDRILHYISNTKGAEDYEKQTNGNFITLMELIMAEENDRHVGQQ